MDGSVGYAFFELSQLLGREIDKRSFIFAISFWYLTLGGLLRDTCQLLLAGEYSLKERGRDKFFSMYSSSALGFVVSAAKKTTQDTRSSRLDIRSLSRPCPNLLFQASHTFFHVLPAFKLTLFLNRRSQCTILLFSQFRFRSVPHRHHCFRAHFSW